LQVIWKLEIGIAELRSWVGTKITINCEGRETWNRSWIVFNPDLLPSKLVAISTTHAYNPVPLITAIFSACLQLPPATTCSTTSS
jgi:hypothetical protein